MKVRKKSTRFHIHLFRVIGDFANSASLIEILRAPFFRDRVRGGT